MIDTKYERLIEFLKSKKNGILAYSGGLDSTFLLYAIKESGISAAAVIGKSVTMPKNDLATALQMIEIIGIQHRIIETSELTDENFISNPPNRCFYCKNALFGALTKIANVEGFTNIFDGSTIDDLNDYRPGLKAKELHNVISPLIIADLNKDEIRQLSKEKGLKTWNKPASPCLSSRLPYGERITTSALTMIESAEGVLRELGFTNNLRVRHHGNLARIELDSIDIIKAIDNTSQIVKKFREIGFLYVTIDIEGYVSGKLNRAIK
ncbi:MAG: ATP-dependent sacrificial sulfur transferase LarE [Nitrospirae bacterium]|nr:ATP-dependent sacrificial sulfur transferase LarE [Nitrospirota bacterium]MBF0540587.1 ATP-dependent sacrificial sulfur transferase LarE [Nitrospirota bacterium]